MNLAKVTSARQITIPMEIYKFLKLKPGNKLLFIVQNDGRVVVSNASTMALKEAQDEFAGVAREIGVKNDDDVMDLVREVRYGED